jgi:hypothetical protein
MLSGIMLSVAFFIVLLDVVLLSVVMYFTLQSRLWELILRVEDLCNSTCVAYITKIRKRCTN